MALPNATKRCRWCCSPAVPSPLAFRLDSYFACVNLSSDPSSYSIIMAHPLGLSFPPEYMQLFVHAAQHGTAAVWRLLSPPLANSPLRALVCVVGVLCSSISLRVCLCVASVCPQNNNTLLSYWAPALVCFWSFCAGTTHIARHWVHDNNRLHVRGCAAQLFGVNLSAFSWIEWVRCVTTTAND